MEQLADFTPSSCRVARRGLGFTQEELARRAGVSRATLVNFEAGKGKPLKTSVAAIRRALGQGPKLAHILRALQAAEPKLKEKGVEHLAVFGSVARMEEGPNSDVDIVVDIDPDRRFDLLDLAGVGGFIEDLLGLQVDVVERHPKMKPELAEHIAEDQVYAF